MTTAEILELMTEVTSVRPDPQHRVSLGKVKTPPNVTSYKVYTNSDGLIVLQPHVSIPANEAWLYKNKKAHSSVIRGIENAKAGKARKSKENYTKYIKED